MVITSQQQQEVVARPLANFPPSLWGDRFTSFTLDNKLWDTYAKEIEVLKEQVRSMVIAGGRKPAEQMNLINTIERLGVSYHFEKEIEDQLEQLVDNFEDNDEDYDLFTISLHFRIFRQHGYKMSCDIFNKFRDNNGKFKESLSKDVMGMLSLYEAANLGIRGDEDVLDEALTFTTTHLESMAPQLSHDLADQVKHALNRCLHRSMPRVEARHFISVYQKDPSRTELVLRFAMVDFNQLQLLHKQELCHIARWWKDLDFASKLAYARDRSVECFLWALGAYYEPHYSQARLILTKTFLMLSITDDTYDAYGTFDELKLFTDAVERWDMRAVDELPDYMKPIYRALLNLYDELDKEMEKQGRSYGVHHSKERFKEIVRSYDIESKWFKARYVPTFDEYMKNALVTSTCSLNSTSSFIAMGDIANQDVFAWLQTNPKIVMASSIFCRLIDDIMTFEEEQERGHVATGVECYMKQHGVSKQETFDEFYKMMENAWKDMNEEFLRPVAVNMQLLMRILNLTCVIDVFYKYEDGYTHPERVKDHVISLFVDPIPFQA